MFWLFTIYTGKPVGLRFGSVWAKGKQISVLGKFRSGLALTICRNPYHLPKNLHDGDCIRKSFFTFRKERNCQRRTEKNNLYLLRFPPFGSWSIFKLLWKIILIKSFLYKFIFIRNQ